MKANATSWNPEESRKITSVENRTEIIHVKLTCDKCSRHIEKTVLELEGINEVHWDIKPGIIAISFNPLKTNLNNIEQAISNAGHETPTYKAKPQYYLDTPGCCKFGLEAD